MSLINVRNMSFSYDDNGEDIFKNVNFQIDTDWKLGFIGRNGKGKTTFLNLLMGKYEYSGNIFSDTVFEYFPYEISDQDLSAMDIVKQIAPNALNWEILRELSRLDVSEESLYMPFYILSNGERTKILLAALFLKENNFLLIDEPTNHLDTEGRMILGKYLSEKKGFILVSHDRAFLDSCVDHILAINKADIEVRKGNFSSWMKNKEKTDNFELNQNNKIKKDIDRLKRAAERTAGWSYSVEKSKFGSDKASSDRGFIGHKSAKMMKRAKTIEGRQKALIDEKSTLLKNVESSEQLKIYPLEFHSGTLAELSNLSVFYGERTVCEGVSFNIQSQDRISIQGKNGSGKSSILKLICGEDISYEGVFIKNRQLKISYVPQETSHLKGSLKDYVQNCGIDESLFKAILRKLDFSREQFEKNIENYSGGQKKKVLIARSLCERAHLYVWDEPLNFIDVLSRIQIEKLLTEYKPTILFVEHDAEFCRNTATKTVWL